MYLTTLRKHPHINSNHLMLTVCEIHCLVQLRSITCASLFRSTMFILVDHMTTDSLDNNIITHDRNLIKISFMLCYASQTSLIDLRSLSIHIINEHQINE